MSRPPDDPEPPEVPTSSVFERLASRPSVEGRLREEGEIARGGMGAILRVWDDDLRRALAMKVSLAKPGAKGEAGTTSADERLLHRFLEEAQITGQLEHPGIVPVHELGIDPDGRLFFTMPLVRGANLEQVFEWEREGAEGWNRTRALGVLLKVCEAVGFAHQKGVVHRDLKPANVMVGRFGETYVMDWGLARVLDKDDRRDLRLAVETAVQSLVHTERAEGRTEDSPLATMDGDVVGTPCYMPPEQARGDIDAIGPPSDVYAIGAMLYHLLAGSAPYLEKGAAASPVDVLRRLRDGAPRPIAELAKGVPEELIAIADKAMARDAKARYASSTELGEDLRAFLEDRVVRAHASGPVAEFRKWFRRNRAAALAGTAAVLLAAAGLVTTVLVQADANERLEVSGNEARDARDSALAAEAELRDANVELERARDLEIERREALERSEYAANLAAASASLRLGDVGEARVRLLACAEPLRAWEWRHLWRAANAQTTVLYSGSPQARRIAAHPGGALLAIAFEGAPLRLVRSDDGELVGEFAPADDVLGPIAFTPDGEVLARVAGDRSVHRLRVSDGTWLEPLASQRRPLTALAFSPDGSLLATAASDKSVRLWDVATGEELAELEEHSGYAAGLAFTPDGRGLVSGGRDRRVLLWDVAERRLVREYLGCEHPVAFVAVSPDGREVAAGSSLGSFDRSRVGDVLANSVRTWDLESSGLRSSLPTTSSPIATGGYSPDGRWLGAVSHDGSVRLWDRRSGRTRSFVGHPGGVADLAFGPDGEWLVSLDGGGSVQRWDVEVAQGLTLHGHSSELTGLAFSPDGSRLYSTSLDQTVRAWGTAHGQPEAVWRLPNFGVMHAGITPDGETLVCAQADGAVRAFDVRSGRQRSVTDEADDNRMRIPQFAPAFALDPTGGRYAIAGRTQPVELRDLERDEVLQTFAREHDVSVALAIDHEARWLAHSETALVGRDSLLVVWDLASGAELFRLTLAPQAASLAFSPDGALFAYSSGQRVVLVGTSDWSERATLKGHTATVRALAFTPDGRRLISGSSDGRLRVWDPSDGAALLTLEVPGGEVQELAFDADETLAIARGDWSVALWDSGEVAPRVAARDAERAARLEVLALLDGVFAATATPEAALERLRADPMLEADDLRVALTLAGMASSDPDDLWRDHWRSVRAPGGDRVALHLALWSASQGRRADPGDVEAALIEGAALLRLGRAGEALEPLLEAQESSRRSSARGRVEVEALLGLGLFANERNEQGRAQLERVRELMQIPTVAMRLDAQALLGELETAAAD